MQNYLADRRKQLGLTQRQVADLVGVSEATVSRWESGNIANMRRDRIALYAKALQSSTEFIMTGTFTEENNGPTPFSSNILPMPKMRQIPLLGTIACGEPILAAENLEGEVNIPENIHADFALRCKGDSMINARIFDGDIVYIRQCDIVDNGEIAAVLIDDEATLKRVQIYPDHISLEPENPQYRPLVYWENDMNSVRILGKAVAFTSAVR